VTAVGSTNNELARVIEPSNLFQIDRMCATIIGGCHSLAFTEGNLVGDPLEKMSFD